jgi:S1-C subfamily serine protease
MPKNAGYYGVIAEMPSYHHYIGIVGFVDQSEPNRISIREVLGTGFVVHPIRGGVVTCKHVLPKEDLIEGKVAFITLDEQLKVSGRLIDVKSYRHHPDIDLVYFEVGSNGFYRTFPFLEKDIEPGDLVRVVGLPKNKWKSDSDSTNVINFRCLTSFVVSGYEAEMEIDKGIIKGMSGSPVFYENSVVGMAYRNEEYAFEQVKIEEEVDEHGKKETYRYEEIQKFGVFYKSSIIKKWLDSMQ